MKPFALIAIGAGLVYMAASGKGLLIFRGVFGK